jgi:hypothetical protein
MKVVIEKKEVIPGVAADAVPPTTTTYDVPNTAIAKVSAIIGIVITLAQALTGFITSLTVTVPKGKADIDLAKAKIELVEKNFKIQMLQRVLDEGDESNRAKSLKLLLATGLLNDSTGELKELINTPANMPKWRERQLESLKEGLSLLGSGQSSAAADAAPAQTLPAGGSNPAANKNANTAPPPASKKEPVDPGVGPETKPKQ